MQNGTNGKKLSSLWFDAINSANYMPLQDNLSVEICIIGGGIAGLTTAYQLSGYEKTIAIIAENPLTNGQSFRTTAHLANGLDDHYFNIEKIHGQDGAQLAAESHTEAINFIEAIIHREHIDCDFRRLDGYLFLSPDQDKKFLQKELEAAHRANLSQVELIENPILHGIELSACLRFPNQGQFHPIKYLNKLANIIQQKGIKLYNAHAEAITPGKSITIRTRDGYAITADHLVIATNAPIYDKDLLFTKQEANRTYVIGAEVPKDSISYALYWDTDEPYHYVRLQPSSHSDKDILIIGGEDHRVGQFRNNESTPFDRLEKWARSLFTSMQDVIYEWSGQIQEPVDYLAFIGRMSTSEHNIYVVTGDSGNGMTHGTIAGILISDLILARKNKWEKLYNPSRTTLKHPTELLRHNIASAKSYIRYITSDKQDSITELPPNEGKVIHRGLKNIAVYRDPRGAVHELSAVCPHMGGSIVCWNPIEKSWDCPAHGSRFDICGNVLNGPAKTNLKNE